MRDQQDPSTAVGARTWSARLVVWTVVLTLANVLADLVVGSPMMVLPQLMTHLQTDQAAWLTAGAMLSGAIWSPLLAKCSDVFGKRRLILVTLMLACAGALICLVASDLWVFLVGRFFQGAALAAVFLTVTLTQQICEPPAAMAVVGILVSGSSIIGILEPLVMLPIIETFGFRGVFVAAALLAAASAVCVRAFVPESPVRTTGRIDVSGALLLGVGLGATLAYISLGSTEGWGAAGMLALLATGVTSSAAWAWRALRVDEPIVDIRGLSRPILLTLLTLALAAGSFRSMMQLIGITAHVPADLNLGYGLGGADKAALLLGAANLGIFVGGVGAGAVAARFGPSLPLLGGVAIGSVATFSMVIGVSRLAPAIACAIVLGMAAGAIGASGYNLATHLETPARQGMTAGLVSVALALGSVVVSIAGGEVLRATRVADASDHGAPVSSAAGVYLYITLSAALLILASIPAFRLRRSAVGAIGRG